MLTCPRCGSLRIHLTSHWLTAVAFAFTRQRYVQCARCHYHGWMAHTERLDSERRGRGHSLRRRHGRSHGPDNGGPRDLSLDPTTPVVENEPTPGQADDRGEPDLSSLDLPLPAARSARDLGRVSAGGTVGRAPAAEVQGRTRHGHRRHRHGSSHRQDRREWTDERVILLVSFVAACVAAVFLLSRACGRELQPQQPLASGLPPGVHVSSRASGIDEMPGRGQPRGVPEDTPPQVP